MTDTDMVKEAYENMGCDYFVGLERDYETLMKNYEAMNKSVQELVNFKRKVVRTTCFATSAAALATSIVIFVKTFGPDIARKREYRKKKKEENKNA